MGDEHKVSKVDVLGEKMDSIQSLLNTHCQHCATITGDVLDRLSKGATKMALTDQRMDGFEKEIRDMKDRAVERDRRLAEREAKRDKREEARQKWSWLQMGAVLVTMLGVIANLIIAGGG